MGAYHQQQTDDYTAANQQEMEVIIQQETVAYISEKRRSWD